MGRRYLSFWISVYVVRGIRNKQQNRSRFVVKDEGVRPALVIEVVSPRYRKEDRETKVEQYERAQIQEYLIVVGALKEVRY